MTSKAKVFVYGAVTMIGLLLAIILTVLAHSFHSYSGLVVGTALFVLTTFFASLTKFAKGVITIIGWKFRSRCTFNEYPGTLDQRTAAREKLTPELERLAKVANRKQGEYEALSMKCRPRNERLQRLYDNSLSTAKLQADASNNAFMDQWGFMKEYGILPINPTTEKPWNDDPESFLGYMANRGSFTDAPCESNNWCPYPA